MFEPKISMSYSFRSYILNETGKVGDQQLTPDVTVLGGGGFSAKFSDKVSGWLNIYILTHSNPISHKTLYYIKKTTFKTCLLFEPKISMSYSFRSHTSNETGKVGDQQLTPDVTVSSGGGLFCQISDKLSSW